jgi:hypothetical protein
VTSYTVVNARGRTVLPASDAATAAIVSCCLFATAAHADVMGAIPRGPDGMGGDFPADASPGTTQTWQVNLEAGKDFAFVAAFDGYGAVILRNASGQAVMSFQVTPYNEDYWFGHEFRAAYTGAYFLDLTAGPETAGYGAGWYWLAYQYDCPGGRRTACTLPVGTSRKSYVTFPYEWDWWKTTLKAGKRYDITTNEYRTDLALRDAKGSIITIVYGSRDSSPFVPPTIRGFQPQVSGTYYVDVEGSYEPGTNGGFFGPYTVSLKAR